MYIYISISLFKVKCFIIVNTFVSKSVFYDLLDIYKITVIFTIAHDILL